MQEQTINYPGGGCARLVTPDDGREQYLHLYGEMDLPYPATMLDSFHRANDIAEACGYFAEIVGNRALLVGGSYSPAILLVWKTRHDDTLADIITGTYEIARIKALLRTEARMNEVHELKKNMDGLRGDVDHRVYNLVDSAYWSLLEAHTLLANMDTSIPTQTLYNVAYRLSWTDQDMQHMQVWVPDGTDPLRAVEAALKPLRAQHPQLSRESYSRAIQTDKE